MPVAMDGASLRLHDAAIGIDLPHFVEQRHGFVGDPHAGLFAADSIAAAKAGRDGLVQRFERQTLRDAEAKTGQRDRLERLRTLRPT